MQTPQIVPICKVEVDGRELPAEARQDILCVQVEQVADGADTFLVELNNDAFWSDSANFEEGKKVKIQMGYLGETPETVFEGEILKREVLFPTSGPSRLFVSGFDGSHRLRRTYYHRSFCQMTDSEIASKIASECGLSADVESTSPKRDWVYQVNQTNLDFLRERARLCNFDVKVDGKKLLFKKPQTGGSEIAKLKWGRDLMSFRPRLSTYGLSGQVEVRGWNPDEKKEIIGKASASDAGSRLGSALGVELATKHFGSAVQSFSDRPVGTLAEAESIAKARMATAALGFVVGDGSSKGNPKIKAGKVLGIEGVGKRFEGKYFLSRVQHIHDSRGYVTSFSFTSNSINDGPPPPVAQSQYSREVAIAKAMEPAPEQKPDPVLINARWSKDRAREGQMVLMHVEAYDFAPGTSATFKIFQRDAAGKTTFVEEKQGQIAGKEASLAYSYTYQDGRDLQPADFFFKVSAGGKEANSNFLKVRDSATVDATIAGTDIPLAHAQYEAELPDGSKVRGTLDKDGKATLPPFSPGKYKVTFPEKV